MNVSPRGSGPAASPAKFAHYRQQTDVVQDVSAFNTGVMNYTGGSFPEQLRSGRVSADFFKLIGAPVLLGRTFTADEDRPGGPRVTVIARHLWETRFNADPNIVGKTISLGGEPYTIVGVLERARLPRVRPDAAGLGSLPVRSEHDRPGTLFPGDGPAQAGVTLQQANGRLQRVGQGFPRQVPDGASGRRTASACSRFAT